MSNLVDQDTDRLIDLITIQMLKLQVAMLEALCNDAYSVMECENFDEWVKNYESYKIAVSGKA